MTLLKLLATALVALSFMVIALPGYAANDGDGVTNNTQEPAAKPRRHKHQHGQRHHRQQNPNQGPANGGNGQG
jgi:hypothetical protein